MIKTIKVGTVKGRHELPVDLYIADDSPVKIAQVEYNRLYRATEEKIEELRGNFLEIMFAGYHPHLLAVVDALDYYGIPFMLKVWDYKSNSYQDLRRVKR